MMLTGIGLFVTNIYLRLTHKESDRVAQKKVEDMLQLEKKMTQMEAAMTEMEQRYTFKESFTQNSPLSCFKPG